MAGPKSGFIAIVGRPNAGKSTLLNQILGTKISIVTPKAQTTREKVLGIFTDDHGQIVFVDTPGIHKAREGGFNEFMVSQARDALAGSDHSSGTSGAPSLVWYLVDPKSGLEHETAVLEILKGCPAPVMILMTKADLISGANNRAMTLKLGETIAEKARAEGIKVIEGPMGVRAISSERDKGVEELMNDSWGFIEEGPLYYPDEEQLSDRPTRFFIGEKIREQLFLKLGEEIPYSCAVEIESFNEKTKPPRIEATIHVERESQKGIVIGKGGQKIKEIGQAARKEAEEFLGYQIHLGLQVKLLKDWSRNAEALKRLGYHLPKSMAKARKA
jgi:GTP-binding protein Era